MFFFFPKGLTTYSYYFPKIPQKWAKLYNFLEIKIHVFTLRIIGQVNNRGPPSSVNPNYTATIKHQESYKIT